MPEFHENRSGPPQKVHVPVMLREVLQFLQLEPGLTVVDGTLGAGGHSREICRRISPGGTLIGLDRDARMLEIADLQLSGLSSHLHKASLHKASYAELPRVLADLSLPAVDRILLDLGLSSDQLADQTRGFSFNSDGPLDLRYDTSQGEPAAELVMRLNEQDLAEIFEKFGDESHARGMARNLVQWRSRQPIRTGRDLAEAVGGAQPARQRSGRGAGRPFDRHPATRIFQALRIAVNNELQQLETALDSVLDDCLHPAGIVVVISFHSLEDRLVKQAFRNSTLWQLLSPKPITASPAEQRLNPRSRSARLRAAKKRPAATST